MAETSGHDYLRRVEVLAREVVESAIDEGWLSLAADPPSATGLQRAVNELARSLRYAHYDGDGCVEH